MNRRSLLKSGLLAAATVLASAHLSAAHAQLTSQLVSPLAVVSLTSFAPATPILNPTFPVATALRHTATGSPSHYRFSRFADFRDAAWLPYTAAPGAQIPASWFTTVSPPAGAFNRSVVLHLQLRAVNPKAGRPISRVTNPFTRTTTLEVEPQFVNSNVRSATILAGFAS